VLVKLNGDGVCGHKVFDDFGAHGALCDIEVLAQNTMSGASCQWFAFLARKKNFMLYLHGFASGPSSRKAQYFKKKFAELGVALEVPALDEGDFLHLTLRRQRKFIETITAQNRPRVVIGSSMGGYLAALYASEHPLDALVLLAPAVDFATRWREREGEERLAKWKRDGVMETFHHGLKQNTLIRYDLMEDAPNHEPWPKVSAPTLVFHGVRDEVVPQYKVEHWVSQNPTARLRLVDAGHEFLECLELIFDETVLFLKGLGLL
jgi:pimeloyl-ACP methyl ester carboxylesterase